MPVWKCEVGNKIEDIFTEARADEADGQQDGISDGEAVDKKPKKIAADPGMPGQAEVDEHEVDHTPYRQLCEVCIQGRGTGESLSHSDGVCVMPVAEFYCFFVTNKEI